MKNHHNQFDIFSTRDECNQVKRYLESVLFIIEDFEEYETPLAEEIEARVIARVCKRAAVKAGQVLSNEEQRALLRDLESCRSPRTCPHGRPTMIHLSVDLLERQFGRKGAR